MVLERRRAKAERAGLCFAKSKIKVKLKWRRAEVVSKGEKNDAVGDRKEASEVQRAGRSGGHRMEARVWELPVRFAGGW